ncbi:MFS transporter [Rhodoplanes sp. TEM]|uniref:MFS transporter n=1 Tax=Rhodoplanes tepidamans TaxID=200616 RepID=A0ABT5JBY1_RHOTP|nr:MULTISPECIES: MFS transporter [Rhodoplanes]MDC7786891.1 MFS transporter [Rhodoplanes tepidamans]MDC7987207.1 MFS transporter [Rhodoplanes sp. TEM]MDQ0355413.1 sugar phosphate permease [Rhodoplanes tepidamans]
MSHLDTSSSGVAEAAERPTKTRFVLLACLFIGIFIAYLDRVNVSVLAANDTFLTEMGIKGMPVQIGMMMSVFLAAYGVSNVVLSPIGDYLGPRKAMLLCILLWNVSLLIGGLATVFTTFLVSRVILGIGEGTYYPLQSLFVKNWFPTQERGRANATWIIGQSLSPAIAMPLFTYVIGAFGWRESFHLCFVLGLIPLFILWRYTADTPRDHKRINKLELDHIESGQVAERQKDAAAGSDKLSLFDRIKPFVFSYRFWLLALWYICLQFMYWGLVSWLPVYLKTARGFSWTEMGWLASLPFVFGILFKAVTGWLIDRIGRNAPILCGSMLVSGICLYVGATAPDKYVAAVLLSLATGVCSMGTPAAWTLLQSLVPGKSMSTAGGTMNGIANGLSALSPALIGLFVAMTGGYTGGLICLAVVAGVATVSSGVLAAQRY